MKSPISNPTAWFWRFERLAYVAGPFCHGAREQMAVNEVRRSEYQGTMSTRQFAEIAADEGEVGGLLFSWCRSWDVT